MNTTNKINWEVRKYATEEVIGFVKFPSMSKPNFQIRTALQMRKLYGDDFVLTQTVTFDALVYIPELQ